MTRATAARKRTSGNVSGERAAKAAQARRRASAAEASSEEPKASSNGRSTTKASSTKASSTKASSNGRSTNAKSSKSSASSKTTNPKSSAAKSQTGASKPKAASKASASKPKTSASKPKASAPKPKSGSTKAATKQRVTRQSAKVRKNVDKTAPTGDRDENTQNNGKGGENPVTAGGKHLASALFSSTTRKRKKHPVARALAKRAAKHTVKAVGRKALHASGDAVRSVAEGAGTLGRQAMRAGMSRVVDHRPPIQASVDVAAPISVVWEEWMTFDWFTEGLHNIEDIERDGDELTGRVVAAHDRDWHAEVVDEREQQAFAWRSDEGTDCAGLITFHELGDRLTRIELDLDVMPTNPGEAFLLSLPVPARRAERTLQLFKAHVEFINPDVYEDEEDSDESESDDRDAEPGQPENEGEPPEDSDGDDPDN